MRQRQHAPRRHRQPSGSEPLAARSALGLRATLSGTALVLALAAMVFFAVVADGPGTSVAAVICAVVALVALVDLGVIARRSRG
ncbi:DUF6343 family protein [Spirillospora sp. NPDC029432]|uniref:DUF6343 family protein n=1 Tax=Spirillospora sp. NPDC029432 TaxID=3154599 RepID=UPI00345409DF